MSKQVFRQTSLERLSSPDQLDSLMSVTRPRGWLALLGVALLVAVGLAWAFTGSVQTKIPGHGILIRGGGIYNIVPVSAGQLSDIRVSAGDTVTAGQTIARVAQTELVDEWNDNDRQLAELKQDEANGKAAADAELERQKLERRQLLLKARLELDSRVISPYDGRVLEVKAKKGDYVTESEPLLSIEPTGGSAQNLQAVLYVPAEQGKKIHPGMPVEISPSYVNKEQYGFLAGNVISVSEYPVTSQGMMQVLESEDLVRRLGGDEAPIEVKVNLVPDGDSPSGYHWSNGKGPDMAIGSGTLFDGTVTINTERPVEMFLPIFK